MARAMLDILIYIEVKTVLEHRFTKKRARSTVLLSNGAPSTNFTYMVSLDICVFLLLYKVCSNALTTTMLLSLKGPKKNSRQ